MKKSHHATLALLLLLAAVVCYFAGVDTGITALLALGVVCEIGFWGLLLRRKPRPSL